MQIHDQFTLEDLDGKPVVVDRSVSPGRVVGVFDDEQEAALARDFAAVEAEPWLQDEELLLALAHEIARTSEIAYPSVVRAFERIGVDAVWLLVGSYTDALVDSLSLNEGGAGWRQMPAERNDHFSVVPFDEDNTHIVVNHTTKPRITYGVHRTEQAAAGEADWRSTEIPAWVGEATERELISALARYLASSLGVHVALIVGVLDHENEASGLDHFWATVSSLIGNLELALGFESA